MQAAPNLRASRGCSFRLIVTSALIMGLIVVGWWLLTQRQIYAGPCDLSPMRQEALVCLVAEEYWQTRDASLAKEVLGGLDVEELAGLLVTMEVGASNAESRDHLVALREALLLDDVPVPIDPARPSVPTLLINQKLIITTGGLAALVLAVAVIIAIAPLVQRTSLEEKLPGWNSAPAVQQQWETPEQQIVAQILADGALQEQERLSPGSDTAEPAFARPVGAELQQEATTSQQLESLANMPPPDSVPVVPQGRQPHGEENPSVQLQTTLPPPDSVTVVRQEGQPPVKAQTQNGLDAESAMKMLIHMDDLVTEQDIDLQDVVGPQNVLANIFDSRGGTGGETGIKELFAAQVEPDLGMMALMDVIGDELEGIDIYDLSHHCRVVADQLRKGNSLVSQPIRKPA